jgi:hypothetical protein
LKVESLRISNKAVERTRSPATVTAKRKREFKVILNK